MSVEHKQFKSSRWLPLITRLFLGGVFIYAGVNKILHPADFARAVYHYQLLPDDLINLTALILPWLELLLGVCLVGGFWIPGATVISTGLLTIFIGAMVFNEIRGLNIQCGCFSTQMTEGPANLWTVARDLGFWAVSVYLTRVVFFFRQAASKS